jgi:hypothetical protein
MLLHEEAHEQLVSWYVVADYDFGEGKIKETKLNILSVKVADVRQLVLLLPLV